MRFAPFVVGFAVALAGCGGSSFDVAEEFNEAGGGDADATTDETAVDAGDDAPLAETDPGETGDPDTGTPVDTGTALDTGTAIDTSVVDTAVADTAVVDTAVVDSAVSLDTAVADTGPLDTGADTGPTCTPTGPESCNGLDDDCNGLVDDGIPIVPCGVGACRVTPSSACTAGAPTVCTPGAPAASDTTCNGIDDDCDGVVDDGCAVCARYVLAGAVGGTGLTPASPLGTIQAAINSMTAASAKGIVCVAATAPAGVCVSTVYSERVTMAEGVSVFGNYKPGTAWTRGDAACVTVINDVASASPTGAGVYFGHALTNATQLDGFTVNGINSTSPTASSAITMQGGGTVTNNVITGGVAAASYGLNLVAPSAATLPAPVIMRNSVSGGSSSLTTTVSASVGIRISNLAPAIRNNRSITGGTASNNSRGIEISNSGRGAQITDNTLISGGAANLAIGIDANGDVSSVVIARNAIASGVGNGQARAISALSCNTSSGSASILENSSITAAGGTGAPAYGIAVQNGGAGCSVLIDSNAKIVGKTSNGSTATAVWCSGAGTACTVTNNAKLAGFDIATGGAGKGVHVLGGASGTIRRNASIVGCGVGGSSSAGCAGVHLEGAAPSVVDANVFAMNYGNYASGVRVRWTNANVRNNVVWVNGGNGIELDVRPSSSGAFEAIVHSNTVIAPPTSAGTPPIAQLLVVDNETSSGPPNGVFRNNLAICQGTGLNRTAFREFGSFGDPRVLENNDFFGCATLYADRETGNLTSISAINALADVPVKGSNVSVDPALVTGGFRLSATSPVIDLGTAAGCPATDHDLQSRPARMTCDIGADEVP